MRYKTGRINGSAFPYSNHLCFTSSGLERSSPLLLRMELDVGLLSIPLVIVLDRGGGLFSFSPKSYVDVPAGPGKSDYLYTNFLPNFPPINIPFSKEKHPVLTKLGAFYSIWPKMHPIYVIWAPLSLMKTPDRYTKFCEKAPQKAGTYKYTISM